MASVNVCCGPPFSPKNFWPFSSNSTPIGLAFPSFEFSKIEV
jgi:hypothetical protein